MVRSYQPKIAEISHNLTKLAVFIMYNELLSQALLCGLLQCAEILK